MIDMASTLVPTENQKYITHLLYNLLPVNTVAYLSMEFMPDSLGNVAGDQLKAASDLGVPVVGVRLFYQQGYFHQVIEGLQQALCPYNGPSQLPIAPLHNTSGDLLRMKVTLSGHPVWLRFVNPCNPTDRHYKIQMPLFFTALASARITLRQILRYE
jgi:hypothetical protein